MKESKKFIKAEAKILPVILILDRSGSMYGEKIDSLNRSVAMMLKDFGNTSGIKAEIKVAIISFGGKGENAKATLDYPLTSASKIDFKFLEADGESPLGDALKMAKNLVEDREIIGKGTYRPVVILVSDGICSGENTQWKDEFNRFANEGRSAMCERWALAIGKGSDRYMLEEFIGDSRLLFEAYNVGMIRNFFNLATAATVKRLESTTPNKTVYPEIEELDEDIFDEDIFDDISDEDLL